MQIAYFKMISQETLAKRNNKNLTILNEKLKKDSSLLMYKGVAVRNTVISIERVIRSETRAKVECLMHISTI